MQRIHQTTSFAVMVGVAVGVVITLGSGELRAALDTAGPRGNGGTTAPQSTQKTAAQALAEEKAAFRAKALEALKPELAAIDARAKAIEAAAAAAKTTFGNHTHEVELTSHGWVKLDVLLASDHHDTVPASYLDNWVAIRDPSTLGPTGTFPKSTSKPK